MLKTFFECMEEHELIAEKNKLLENIHRMPDQRIARNILYDLLGVIEWKKRYSCFPLPVDFP